MRSARFFLGVVALLIGILGTNVEVNAQFLGDGFGPWGGGFWNQPAFGVGGSLYGSGYVPVPPYFSIHPPVYYSGRIYRPYGDSPFAYGPSRFELSRTAASVADVRPEMIANPYFQPSSARPANASAAANSLGNANAEPAAKMTPKKKASPLPAPKSDDNARMEISRGSLPIVNAPRAQMIHNPYVHGRMGGTARLTASISAPTFHAQ